VRVRQREVLHRRDGCGALFQQNITGVICGGEGAPRFDAAFPQRLRIREAMATAMVHGNMSVRIQRRNERHPPDCTSSGRRSWRKLRR